MGEKGTIRKQELIFKLHKNVSKLKLISVPHHQYSKHETDDRNDVITHNICEFIKQIDLKEGRI